MKVYGIFYCDEFGEDMECYGVFDSYFEATKSLIHEYNKITDAIKKEMSFKEWCEGFSIIPFEKNTFRSLYSIPCLDIKVEDE